MDEVKLWNDFIKGDNDAFGLIYNKYVQSLFRYGCHFAADRDLVKDCIQDVFLDFQHYRSSMPTTCNIKAYLFKSLKHKIIKALNKVKELSSIENENSSFHYCVSFEDEIVAGETERHLNSLVSQAFAKLSQRQKEAIYLKFVSGLSYEEIGDILQVNYQSARNLVFRSLEKMRECHRNILIFFLNLLKIYPSKVAE